MKTMSTPALVVLTFALAAAFDGAVEAADISGLIKGDGAKPVAGAWVKIISARMRAGASPMCPTCWTDCQKSARTGTDGRYHLAGVSDDLVFDLLVLADGHAPLCVEDVDPAKTSTADAVLKSRDLSSILPAQLTHGRVVGSDGRPIAGARVASTMPHGVDRIALTDSDGRFALVWSEAAQRQWLRISADGWGSARAESKVNRNGIPKPVEVRLSRGVTITGRVTDEHGKPAPRVKVGAIQAQRSYEKDLPPVEAETGGDGFFFLFHVPAHDELAVYGLMESLEGKGALPINLVNTGADEETVRLQDLVIQRACTLSGQFVLPNGKKFPPKSRIILGRDGAWDSKIVELSPDGQFQCDGLPKGEMIVVRFPGEPSNHNALSANRGFEIDPPNLRAQGVLEGDVHDLKIDLIWRDPMGWQEEMRRQAHRSRHGHFLRKAALSSDREMLFITASVQREDAEIAAAGSDAGVRAAGAEFEKQVRLVLGERGFQLYLEMDKLTVGRQWVFLYSSVRKGPSLAATEEQALVQSISRHMNQFYQNHRIEEGKVLTKDERHQWHDSQYDSLRTGGEEVLPPAKLAFFREWVEKTRIARWEEICEMYEQE